MRAFSFSDTCDPSTPPRGLNLPARDPRPAQFGSRAVDLVPRYPANVNELDERAADLADLADLAQNMGAQSLTGSTFERQLSVPAGPKPPDNTTFTPPANASGPPDIGSFYPVLGVML